MSATLEIQSGTGGSVNVLVDGLHVVAGPFPVRVSGSVVAEADTNWVAGSSVDVSHYSHASVVMVPGPVVVDAGNTGTWFWMGAGHGAVLALTCVSLLVYRRFGRLIVSGGD